MRGSGTNTNCDEIIINHIHVAGNFGDENWQYHHSLKKTAISMHYRIEGYFHGILLLQFLHLEKFYTLKPKFVWLAPFLD